MLVRRLRQTAIAAGMIALCGSAMAQIKIAYIDPLSGPFANVGEAGAKQFQMLADEINAKGGVLGGQKIEIVKFDNKVSPQESLIQLKSVIDQGIRYITQGNGSSVAHALTDAVAKHNSRNPDKTILYLNYAAVDPDLTNKKCNFWHFRFDANSDMKLEAITNYIRDKKNVKKVYIIGQDYAFGHQVRKAAREMLNAKRPDVEIVGDDLHPLGKVKDFAPYVSKIKAAGADTVITGNWGTDMTLLIKAAKDAGLKANFYTFYAGGLGTPTAMGDAAADRVLQVTEWHMNVKPNKTEKFALEFKSKTGIDLYYLRVNNLMYMLRDAINKAGSADPLKVALTMEDMRFQADTGEIWMRKSDHQMIQPLYISTYTKADGKDVKHDVESTGHGFKTNALISARDSQLPTTCIMERPQ